MSSSGACISPPLPCTPSKPRKHKRQVNHSEYQAIPVQWPVHIHEEFENRLSQRTWVLDDYYHRYAPEFLDQCSGKIWSANADIKTDVIVARRSLKQEGKTFYLDLVRKIYGVNNLNEGLEETIEPTDTPATDGSSPNSRLPNTRFEARLLSSVSPSVVPNNDDIKPWGKVAEYGPRAQSLHEALQAPLRRSSQVLRPRLIDHDDMMAILNARGTSLLNTCFVGTPAQKKILALSHVALDLWRNYVAAMLKKTVNLYPTTSNLETNETIINFRFIVPIILDDIHTYLLRAIESFSARSKQHQKQHINVFKNRVSVWQNGFQGYLRGACRPYHDPRSLEHASVQVHKVKQTCEDALRRYDSVAEKMVTGLHAVEEVHFNVGAGYTGAVQVIPGMAGLGRLEVPGLERNGEGVWLGF